MIEDEGFFIVADALSALVESLNRCKSVALRPGAIGQSAFYCPTGNRLEGDSAELFIKAISDWDVMHDADHGNVPRYPALVEADAELIDAVEDFNACKLAFKAAVSGMEVANDKERQSKLRDVLRRQGLARAHPLQCWREVNVFRSSTVKTVGFSTTKKSFSSKVLTRIQAIIELEKRDAQDVIGDIEDKERETQKSFQTARWVNPVSPFIRVNISFRKADGALDNTTFHASLPIIIEKGSWPAKLNFNQPKESTQDRMGLEDGGISIIPLPFRRDAYLALS
jgi:hypothetical protein